MAKLPKGIPKAVPRRPAPQYVSFTRRDTKPPFSRPDYDASARPQRPQRPQRPPQPLPIDNRPTLKGIQIQQELQKKAEQGGAGSRVNKWRQLPLMVCGLMAFGLGAYTVSLWISLNNAPDPKDLPAHLQDLPADLQDRFDKEAEGYDEKVNTAEFLIGLSSKRKAMMQRAYGHVLEVAVGTGRNTSYFPVKKCDTVTLLDSSGPMLAVAKRKWKDTHPEYFNRVFFKQQSALEPITPPYGAQDGFDTVIQTFGLCSTPEPVKLLQSLEAATKEDGQILLLEHGKSHYNRVNNWLDKTAPAHADEHGCWWNKDIGKIVEESGLEVVDIKRYNFGTTWWVELKPRKGIRAKLAAAAMQATERVSSEAPAPASPVVTQKPWWSLWR